MRETADAALLRIREFAAKQDIRMMTSEQPPTGDDWNDLYRELKRDAAPAGHQVVLMCTLTDEFLHDIMTTALESGIGYWAAAQDVRRTADLSVTSFMLREEDPDAPSGYADPLLVDAGAITTGIQRLVSGQIGVGQIEELMRAVRESDAGNIDAELADCIVQAAMLNEIRYG